uniref:hypothetical protein n=1 Tax=Trichocoleus desertorum TaxID=1481672 RepID=UPI0025B4F5B5|nr:hypothetical protein [Trichocoleus desertorum]
MSEWKPTRHSYSVTILSSTFGHLQHVEERDRHPRNYKARSRFQRLYNLYAMRSQNGLLLRLNPFVVEETRQHRRVNVLFRKQLKTMPNLNSLDF